MQYYRRQTSPVQQEQFLERTGSVVKTISSTLEMATKSTSSTKANANTTSSTDQSTASAPQQTTRSKHGVKVVAPAKDRIKTPDQFKVELEHMMETNQRHKEKMQECKQLAQELKTVRARVLPFMLDNLKQNRVNCSKFNTYISSTVVQRKRKVRMEDLYEIIERELGPENRKLIKQKAEELAAQKVSMRQTRIMPLSLKRAENKKRKAQDAKSATLRKAARQ